MPPLYRTSRKLMSFLNGDAVRAAFRLPDDFTGCSSLAPPATVRAASTMVRDDRAGVAAYHFVAFWQSPFELKYLVKTGDSIPFGDCCGLSPDTHRLRDRQPRKDIRTVANTPLKSAPELADFVLI